MLDNNRKSNNSISLNIQKNPSFLYSVEACKKTLKIIDNEEDENDIHLESEVMSPINADIYNNIADPEKILENSNSQSYTTDSKDVKGAEIEDIMLGNAQVEGKCLIFDNFDLSKQSISSVSS